MFSSLSVTALESMLLAGKLQLDKLDTWALNVVQNFGTKFC